MLEVQSACEGLAVPNTELFEQWVSIALRGKQDASVVIRLVDLAEGAELNETYRKKSGATNVLSFPFERPEGLPASELSEEVLGDLVICVPIVIEEAGAQNKPVLDHWAHLVIHGCFHLQGYDHVDDKQALEMEALEVQLLAELDIKNPYIECISA